MNKFKRKSNSKQTQNKLNEKTTSTAFFLVA